MANADVNTTEIYTHVMGNSLSWGLPSILYIAPRVNDTVEKALIRADL